MATATNAMAAASIQPKMCETGNIAIVCTQALISTQTSGSAWKLFNVASDMTIVDVYMRLQTAASTAASLINLGVATNAATFIASYAQDSVAVGRATAGLPYTCTADTPIYAYTSVGAATAASNLVVVAIVTPKDNMA